MDKTREVLKALRIKIPSKKAVRPPPERTSPLFTHFERWAGKKRRLFFKEAAQIKQLESPALNLTNNPFARILASPMRLDRLSGIKMPRELTIQVNSRLTDPTNVLLAPLFSHNANDKHSYVLNKAKAILKRANNPRAVLPLHTLREITDEGMDKAVKGKSKRTDPLQVGEFTAKIKDTLWEMLTQDRKSTGVSGSQVKIISDKKQPLQLNISTSNQDKSYIITINLAMLEEARIDKFLSGQKNSELLLDVANTDNTKLILYILRVVTFLT